MDVLKLLTRRGLLCPVVLDPGGHLLEFVPGTGQRPVAIASKQILSVKEDSDIGMIRHGD